ncbi:hypothetical protein MYAM1_002866 [Malassezia yamatoensis]|uniref:Elongator complex protein 5 n=1 Tax=Malassezia yamatoensis TaxID=253288 RepID=A0AAJ5Z0S3_9BASI|nr:hypothetical protein MYAM1_002866 [Malassezia yamatoensis]
MASVACALLDHSAIALTAHANTRLPQNKQMILMEGSLAQSGCAVVREMLLRNQARNENNLVLCTLHSPEIFGVSSQLDFSRIPEVSLEQLERKVVNEVRQRTSRSMLVLDSLEGLLDVTNCSVAQAYTMLRRVLYALPEYSRLVVMTDLDVGHDAQTLASALQSPQLWSASAASKSSESSFSHATIRVRVHPPELLRYLYSDMKLTPPTSSQASRRAAYAEAQEHVPDPSVSSSSFDPRFWRILSSVGARGPLGVKGGEIGWWNAVGAAGLHTIDSSTAPYVPEVCAEQVLGLHSDTKDTYATGIGYLELHVALSNGKYLEELAACINHTKQDGSVRVGLSSLNMSTSDAIEQTSKASSDPHASMVQQLPFNLGETSQQRERREQVALPYAYQLQDSSAQSLNQTAWRGSTGKSAIFFEPESEDDEDDDDPDDDLDV